MSYIKTKYTQLVLARELCRAIRDNSSREKISSIVKKGASPDGIFGYRPLLVAAKKDNTDAMEELLMNNANPNKGGIMYRFSCIGYTRPIHLAAKNLNNEAAKLLIKHGADPKIRIWGLFWAGDEENPKPIFVADPYGIAYSQCFFLDSSNTSSIFRTEGEIRSAVWNNTSILTQYRNIRRR
jgi:hypothetical protein